jgi:hypothetical protein
MKKKTSMLLILPMSVCLLSGCLVRSLYPWLPDDTKACDVSLVGTWQDEKTDLALFFTAGSASNYDLLAISDKKDPSKFTASLCRLGKTLFVVVGPEERGDMGSVAMLPGYLLFKVDLSDGAMKWYGLDLASFGDRADASKIKRADEGDKDKGYVVFSPTADLAAFVESQSKDPTFFDEKPLYTFTRVGKP